MYSYSVLLIKLINKLEINLNILADIFTFALETLGDTIQHMYIHIKFCWLFTFFIYYYNEIRKEIWFGDISLHVPWEYKVYCIHMYNVRNLKFIINPFDQKHINWRKMFLLKHPVFNSCPLFRFGKLRKWREKKDKIGFLGFITSKQI